MASCSVSGCRREARMAIRTTRPQRAELKTTVWYDDRTAPATADRYCKEHGAGLLADLCELFVTSDTPAASGAI